MCAGDGAQHAHGSLLWLCCGVWQWLKMWLWTWMWIGAHTLPPKSDHIYTYQGLTRAEGKLLEMKRACCIISSWIL